MKQTAVEWYAVQAMQLEIQRGKGIITISQMLNELSNILEQAKAMEREQMRIHSIDEELFKRLPIEGTNFCSFNVKEFRYFATKYYIDNFKETYESNTRI